MAQAKETKFIVGDQGYLYKEGKVYQTGEEISLTADEAKNVEGKILKADSNEGRILADQFKESNEQDEQKADTTEKSE